MTLPRRRATFIPTVGPQFFSYWKKGYKHNGFDFKWFTPNSFFQYPYALINASSGIQDAWWWRKETGYSKDAIMMTDSGGYQIESYAKKGRSAKISAGSSLRWQEANSNIGFNLDIPVTENDNFDMCLKKSIKNFDLFERNRKNYTMKMYNVLHGRTLQEIETWYDAVKDFNFDGWAIGIKGRRGSIYKPLLGYMVLHENNALNLKDNLHFFGTSSLKSMLALAMLSKHFDTAITFDSSSYSRVSQFRTWYFPSSIRHAANFGRNEKKGMKAIPCRCPVCSHATINDLYSQTNPATHVLIALHNLCQFIETNRRIGIMVEDEDVFTDYAKSKGEQELIKNVAGMLDEYDRSGYQGVNEKYKNLIEGLSKEKPSKGGSRTARPNNRKNTAVGNWGFS